MRHAACKARGELGDYLRGADKGANRVTAKIWCAFERALAITKHIENKRRIENKIALKQSKTRIKNDAKTQIQNKVATALILDAFDELWRQLPPATKSGGHKGIIFRQYGGQERQGQGGKKHAAREING
jgi:hypothetical protein